MFTPAPGAVVGGKYRLERPLAQGGMGAIWVAWQTGLERRVAVKFMARELSSSSLARARFDREARAAAQLRTPHVVQVHDHGIEDDTPFIVMELLEGEDLNTRLRRTKRLPLADAARIAFHLAKALRRAQEAGLVHRDLKPANVFLAHDDGDEIAKILDFGVARLTDGATPDGGESTRSGVVVGSPHYMSPEQARGLNAVDHRSDLWAVGVILFRAVTGAVPFPGNELGDIIIRVWNDPAPTPTELAPDLPPALDAFFARALAKAPADRFQSAPELAMAFAEAAGVAGPPFSSRFDPRASMPSNPIMGAPAAAMATFPTPLSWPGVAGSITPPPATGSGVVSRPGDGAGGTLGGSHGLDPRPVSRVPVVWVAAAVVVAGLCAGGLFLALRAPSTPAASSSGAETSMAVGANVPVGASVPVGANVPVGASVPVGANVPVGASPSALAGPADTGAAPASAPAPAEPSAASPVASGASASASASAKAPRAGNRKGHDFGY